MEPQRLIGRAVNTDEHRGRYVSRLEDSAPLRDHLTVTGEHDCLGRICRDVHRDLPTTVVIERLGDDLSRRSLAMHDQTPDPCELPIAIGDHLVPPGYGADGLRPAGRR